MILETSAAAAAYSGDCWPTREQELLLKAALLEGESALDAWNEWHRSVDVDVVDAGSLRLLPLLYRNLLRHHVDRPLLSRLKGVYRQTWYRNQLLFHQIAATARAFHNQAIETLFLKGVALALLYYDDLGVRPMLDVDILVHPRAVEKALELLKDLGWQAQYSTAKTRIPLIHSIGFEDAEGRQLDLHWHALEECCYEGADAEIWLSAVETKLGGVSVYAPSATDLLSQICVHGAQWNPVPPLRWVADAVTILDRASATIDWDRLVAHAERCRLVLPLRYTFSYLREVMGAPIPTETLQRLKEAPTSRNEELEYRVKTRKRNYWRRLFFHWFNYLRLRDKFGSRSNPLLFLRYLQFRWGVAHFWEIPRFVISEAKKRQMET